MGHGVVIMRTRNQLALMMLASLGAAGVATAQNVTDSGRKLQTTLTGAAEVPPGDPDGSGTATVTVNPGQKRICYTIHVSGIAPPTAAHIHVGAVGTAPPNNVVVPLDTPTDGHVEACAEVTRELALAILKEPSNYYVNVHNADHPTGAVRGQLAK